MGLLKNLMNSVAGKVISQVKDVVANAMQEQNPQSRTQAAPAAQTWQDEPVVERSAQEWKVYFREILNAEYPLYNIHEYVPVTELAGYAADAFQLYKSRPTQVYRAEWGQPYSFVLYSGIAPKAVVMLGAGHSHSANVKYLIARMYAKKLGIPYINFYTQMPNERGYVVSRLHRFLP